MKQDEQGQELFSIIQITESVSRSKRLVKPGMLIKRWLDIPGFGLSLFKVDNPLLSTAWSEKIAAELASKIDLPTVQYELAIDEDNNRGVISPDFMNIGETELEGSDLLNQIYGRGNYLYTLDESINSIVSNNIQLPTKWNNPPEINNAVDLFVGYLLFDSWINNTDRHDENWGIRVSADGRKELLPNFDCGISLGVRVSANDIATNRINPSRYSLIAKSMLFQQQGRSIDNVSFPDLTRQLLDRYPVATKYWSERIAAVPPHEIKELFDRIPEGWISEPAKNFAIELLEFNRQQIASICELAVPELSKIDPSYLDDSPDLPNNSPEPSPDPPTPHNSPDRLNSIVTIEKIASSYYNRAVLQGYDLDDIPGALANFNKAIKLNPKFDHAYYSRAVLKLTKLNDVSGALTDLSKAIELNPEFADAYHHRANLKQTRLRNVAGALVDYDRAIELNPQSIDAYCNRAILKQFRLNDVPGALTDFNKAIELNPQDGNIYYNLANLKQTRLDDLAGALADYDKAIELDSQYANAYYGRANLKQTKLDDISGSILDFRAAATFYQQQGRLEDWEDTIERLEKLESTI